VIDRRAGFLEAGIFRFGAADAVGLVRICANSEMHIRGTNSKYFAPIIGCPNRSFFLTFVGRHRGAKQSKPRRFAKLVTARATCMAAASSPRVSVVLRGRNIGSFAQHTQRIAPNQDNAGLSQYVKGTSRGTNALFANLVDRERVDSRVGIGGSCYW
jgi:hypothetical protein